MSVFSIFSSALQTPLGSAGHPPHPQAPRLWLSIEIFRSVWRVEQIVVRSWRSAIYLFICLFDLCKTKAKHKVRPGCLLCSTHCCWKGAPRWQRPSMRKEIMHRRNIIGSSGPNPPSPDAILKLKSMSIRRRHGKLRLHLQTATATATPPELFNTRWLNGTICP